MTRSLRSVASLALGAAFTSTAAAQGGAGFKVGGFIDSYFAYDFGRPTTIDRAFTTQAVRHSEFNVNLAYVDLTASGDRFRARLALQAGTSVQSNYAGEPAIGANSGPSLVRHIQEAVAGVKVSDKAWIDGGVFYSHIGSESWASRDNLTYTRSLIAEYTPYYEAGLKLTLQPSSKLTATFLVVNGWQIISENNEDKSFGLRLDWNATPTLTVGYYNIFGNEQPDSAESRMRFLNGVTAKLAATDKFTLLATADFGQQDGAGGADASTWWGGAVIARLQATPRVGISARAEAYNDEDQVIIVTGGDAFRATGFSAGVDVAAQETILWRTEFRLLSGKDAVFPDRSETNGLSRKNALLVTSLAFTFR